MKYVVFVLIVVLESLVGYAYALDPGILRIQMEMLQPSVRINDNCSGQIVYSKYDQSKKQSRTLILTAKHCTTKNSNGKAFEIDIPEYNNGNSKMGERLLYAHLLATDGASDLALLEITNNIDIFPTVTTIENEYTPLFIGEDCWAVGYPLGWSIMVSKGLIGPKEVKRIEDLPYKEYLRATAQIAGGSSGGGLYHLSEDGSYKLIGIATAGIPGSGFIAVWTPLSNIVPFLKEWVPDSKG